MSYWNAILLPSGDQSLSPASTGGSKWVSWVTWRLLASMIKRLTLPPPSRSEPKLMRVPSRGPAGVCVDGGEGQLHQAGAVGVDPVDLELVAVHEAGEDDLVAHRPARLDAEPGRAEDDVVVAAVRGRWPTGSARCTWRMCGRIPGTRRSHPAATALPRAWLANFCLTWVTRLPRVDGNCRGAAVGYGTYYTKGNTLEGLPPSVRGLGRSGDQDGSRADLTHRGSPCDRRGPCPPRGSVSWPWVHQPSSPSSSWNVPVGPSLPIVAIRAMFRALISTGRPLEFCTPPSSVAV